MLRRLVPIGLLLLSGAWVYGFCLFLRAGAQPITVRLPALAQHPRGPHNLAAARYGPTLSASSYHRELFAQAHPAFLVDEWIAPTPLERWISDPKDAAPFVRIEWESPHDLSEVVIRYTALVEGEAWVAENYRIECLRGGRAELAVDVRGNHHGLARHAVRCPAATGLSIRFETGRMVGIYEVGAWGE